MANQDPAWGARALREAKRARLPRVAAEETALMLMLYAGYPAALEGLRVLTRTWPGKPRAREEGAIQLWRQRGRRLCRQVHGEVYPKLLTAVRRLHPDLACWMVEQGYGRVLSRPGIATGARELITVSVLTSCGWERQLVSHLLGAERLGCSRGEIERAVAIGTGRAGRSAVEAAQRAWREAFG